MDLKDTVLQALNELVKNGGEGSGDFNHAGRPGLVGGSEPAGTGRKGKYDNVKKEDKQETKEEKSTKRGDLGEDSPRHIYGKKKEGSIPVALKTTYYPNWNKEEVVKEFDSEEEALDYAEERGEAVKKDYINKTKTAEKYGLATWVTPKELEHIKKHGFYPDEEVKEEENKDKLDIKKTTVTTKAGKKREIEYVESVPDGFKELKGALTAPLGYTWYTNGKSILDKSRKRILVKDKANNSIYKHEYIEY